MRNFQSILAVIATAFVFLFSFSIKSSAFELQDRSFFKQNLIIAFDLSQEVVSCKPLLKRNIDVLAELLSPHSLKRGHIRRVIIFTYRRGVIDNVDINFTNRRQIEWSEFSEVALNAFKKLFKESYDPKTSELSDTLGALEKAINYAESLKHRSIIVIISPAIQEYNRDTILKEIRISLPQEVRKVIFLSQPFVCRKASESLKLQKWREYVVNYWSKVLPQDVKKVEFNNSY